MQCSWVCHPHDFPQDIIFSLLEKANNSSCRQFLVTEMFWPDDVAAEVSTSIPSPHPNCFPSLAALFPSIH